MCEIGLQPQLQDINLGMKWASLLWGFLITTSVQVFIIRSPAAPAEVLPPCKTAEMLSVFCNPASHHQVPIKNIERELICPICKELFTHPLILPCQHSVCHKCVRELLMLNHEDSFDAGSECSLPGSPRSRVPSPSMERLDRLVRSGGSRGKEPRYTFFCRSNKFVLFFLTGGILLCTA